MCATCTKYWSARDIGVPGSQCLAKDNCGSPLRGDDFHEYDGPITEFSRWCFVCGVDSKFGITVKGRKRVLGACAKHVDLVNQLKPENGIEPRISVYKPDGWVPVENLKTAPQRKTLAQAIFEVEDYYAKKDGIK